MRMDYDRYREAVRKWKAGERLTPAEENMIAYGYTAAAGSGQRVDPLMPDEELEELAE